MKDTLDLSVHDSLKSFEGKAVAHKNNRLRVRFPSALFRKNMKCLKKIAYMSPEQAANAVRGRQKAGVNYLRVYPCPDCGAFHLTSEKPKIYKVKSKK